MKTINIADKRIIIAAAALIAVVIFLALASQLNSGIQAQIAVPAASEQLTDLNRLNEQTEQIKNQIKVYERYLEIAEKNSNRILADLFKSDINDLKNRLEQLLTEQKNAEETFWSLPISDPERLKYYLDSWKKEQVILAACMGDVIKESIKTLEKMLAEGRRPATDGNLAVISSNPSLAQQTLAEIKKYLNDISNEWAGEPPPKWIEALIYVQFPAKDDQGITWCDFKPGESLPRQSMWCGGEKLNTTVKHETTHIFLNSRFPGGLPEWVTEGMASRYDDEKKQNELREYYKKMREMDDLWELFSIKSIPTSSTKYYALSQLVADYLIQLGNKQGRDGKRYFFEFISAIAGFDLNEDADKREFEERLSKFYGYRVADLQRDISAYWGIKYKDSP